MRKPLPSGLQEGRIFPWSLKKRRGVDIKSVKVYAVYHVAQYAWTCRKCYLGSIGDKMTNWAILQEEAIKPTFGHEG